VKETNCFRNDGTHCGKRFDRGSFEMHDCQPEKNPEASPFPVANVSLVISLACLGNYANKMGTTVPEKYLCNGST
jgi:hypothetical protein